MTKQTKATPASTPVAYEESETLKGLELTATGDFNAIDVNGETIPASTVGDIFMFGLKKKAQNEYAGFRGSDEESRDMIEDLLNTFSLGYFTHAQRKAAENPKSVSGGSSAPRSLDALIFVELINTMSEPEQAIALKLPKATIVASFQKNKVEVYDEAVKKAKATAQKEIDKQNAAADELIKSLS